MLRIDRAACGDRTDDRQLGADRARQRLRLRQGQQIRGIGRPGDVLIAICPPARRETSRNSSC